MKVKNVEAAAKKFVTRASAAQGDYKEGVNQTNDQAEKSIASQAIYESQIQDSIARGARVAGIEKSGGTAKWKARTMAVGPSRFATGTAAGSEAYKSGVKPYLDVLSGLTLTPRGPKGSPENLERVRQTNEALRTAKLG